MSERQHDAMRRSLGALALLGVEFIRAEWADSLAVWSYGREPSWLGGAAWGLVALAGGAAAAVALGWRWRVAGALFCASMAGLYALAPVTYHNNLYLLTLLMLLAVLTGGRWKADGAFAWLVRWQVAFVYLASVVVKLSHPFWQGSGGVIRWLALERVPLAHDGIVNPFLRRWLVRPDVSSFLDHATMVVEVAIPVMLYVPRWRVAGFALGFTLHWAFQAWLHPQLFTFLMLWGYFAFAPADDRAWAVEAPARLAPYIERLDWLGRAAVREGPSLVVTTPAGRPLRGLAAIRALASLTPATVPAVAAFALVAPEVKRVGGVSRAAVEEAGLLALGALVLASAWTQLCSPPRR
ncbi:MAG: hypothetical protein U0324_20225 [Polyangiales bacterium]